MFIQSIYRFIFFQILKTKHKKYHTSKHITQQADKTALFCWLQSLDLVTSALATGTLAPGGILEWHGYIVYGDQTS